jgi:polar amino acid transport system substrate-binding protein
MPSDALRELAPEGVLRAGINLANSLLVTGRSPSGDPLGVAPDMARAIADELGVAVQYVSFADPGALADEAAKGVWDIALIGAEPQRAEKILFSPAYVEIAATYLVPFGSSLQTIADVDAIGVRIASTARTAYDLWLERNIVKAALVRTNSLDGAFDKFLSDCLEALAGLRPRLTLDLAKVPGGRVLEGQFMSVQQAIGTARANAAGAAFIRDLVEAMKAAGYVAGLIEKHKVRGLSVAPKATPHT